MDEQTRELFASISKTVSDVGRMISSKRIEHQFEAQGYEGINDLISALRNCADALETQVGTVKLRNEK